MSSTVTRERMRELAERYSGVLPRISFTALIEPFYTNSPVFRPDASWSLVDGAGHEHEWAMPDDGKPYVTSTIEVSETHWCEECRDVHEWTHLECALCREVVEPEYHEGVASTMQQYILTGLYEIEDVTMRLAELPDGWVHVLDDDLGVVTTPQGDRFPVIKFDAYAGGHQLLSRLTFRLQ